MSSRPRALWFPPLLLTVALLPLGARAQIPFHIVLALVAAAALGLLLSETFWPPQQPGLTATLNQTPLLPVFGLAALVICQFLAQLLLGFSNGPIIAMAQSAMLLTDMGLFYLIVRAVTTSPASFRWLLGALALIGVGEASYGLLNLLAGNETLLIYKRWAYLNSATGTLISRNHFAFLIEMLLPVTCAFAAVFSASDGTASGRSEAGARSVLVNTGVVVLALALLFTRSRMGLMSFIAALALVSLANRLLRPKYDGQQSGGGMAVALLATAAIIAFAAIIGLDPVFDRLPRLGSDLEGGRWPIWVWTVDMIKDRPLLGHGWGTFEALLPGYRPEPTGSFYDHAHSEYLEVWAEAGIVGLLFVVALLVSFARTLFRALASPLTPVQRSVIVWLGIAITSVCLHSAADFGLRVTGVGFTFVALLALFTRVVNHAALADGIQRGQRQRPAKKTGRAASTPPAPSLER